MLDKNTFLCNFGCEVEFTSIREIVSHYLGAHSKEELESWAISEGLLAH